jgi:hypothetical protein
MNQSWMIYSKAPDPMQEQKAAHNNNPETSLDFNPVSLHVYDTVNVCQSQMTAMHAEQGLHAKCAFPKLCLGNYLAAAKGCLHVILCCYLHVRWSTSVGFAFR